MSLAIPHIQISTIAIYYDSIVYIPSNHRCVCVHFMISSQRLGLVWQTTKSNLIDTCLINPPHDIISTHIISVITFLLGILSTLSSSCLLQQIISQHFTQTQPQSSSTPPILISSSHFSYLQHSLPPFFINSPQQLNLFSIFLQHISTCSPFHTFSSSPFLPLSFSLTHHICGTLYLLLFVL